MPLLRTALLATAACLIGAAAYAQSTPSDTGSAPQSQPAPQSPDTSMSAAPADQSAAPAGQSTMAPADQSAAPPAGPSAGISAQTAPTGAAANTSTTVDASGNQVIASQPVPDTAANRQAYGSPLSHAGKHTKPAGN